MITAWVVLGVLQAQATAPVLDFPEPGLDDTASYQGYKTRFYRDSKQNTVQIYLDARSGRVVTVLANAANESIGFTVRDSEGRSAPLDWAGAKAEVTDSGTTRTIEYQITAHAPRIGVGLFVLGSMRVERDFVYAKRHLRALTDAPLMVPEESLLVARLERLPPIEKRRHLTLLRAPSVPELRARLQRPLSLYGNDSVWVVRVERPSLDGRNRLVLQLSGDARRSTVRGSLRSFSIWPRVNSPVNLTVRITTDAAPLSPLTRKDIFNREFQDFLARARNASDSIGTIRHRRLERQVRAVELLSSKEKLMAGLPNFATYFGRDMMMTALMMQPIWSAEMSEHVIASVLRKLGPRGDVSHEEALGGQAIRENAVVYDSLIRGGRLEEARAVLGALQKTRENYHMIDDEFQLPVLVARYLADSTIGPAQKLAFLADSSGGRGSRLSLLLRELALVTKWTRPYVDDPTPTKLVSFPKRDATHWRSASWRDSDAGYAGGRFAMDVNAVWAPHALESIAMILAHMDTLGLAGRHLDSLAPGMDSTPLGRYRRDPASLARAIETWRGARRHFEVTLPAAEVERRVQAKLASLPAGERRYWQKIVAGRSASADPLFFLALSLDTSGRPIPVVNTDPATGLFLDAWRVSTDSGSRVAEKVARDVSAFVLPYPVGLLVDSLGPVVANDAYASPATWARFGADTYHSPRVVWGREVNLIFLGLAKAPGDALKISLRRMLAAVEASGLGHNELWSYRIQGSRLLPIRYGTSSDVQLWNTTDLAVEYVLSRLPEQ